MFAANTAGIFERCSLFFLPWRSTTVILVTMVDLIHWHTFDSRMLGPNSVVIDLGANRGEFLSKVHKVCRCATMVAVEPNIELYKLLAAQPDLIAINAAVSGSRGEANFEINENDLASRVVQSEMVSGAATVTVELVTLQDVLNRNGLTNIDLLKIDIEGEEIAMIDATDDDTLRRIAQITIEFHDFCGLVSTSEVKRVLLRLKGLGFFVFRMPRIGHQDTWIVNTRFRHVGPAMRVKMLVVKYSRGMLRIWHKATKGPRWYLAYD